MSSWDQAPVVKGGAWDAAPAVPTSKARAASDAAKRTANTPGLVRAISQGATFGFSDELDAKLAGLETRLNPFAQYSPQEAEQAVLDANRQSQKGFEKEHPVQNFAAQVLGGAALPSLGIMKGATGVGSAVARGAGIGAAAGYGYGLGNAEGSTLERQPSALGGAALGAVLGGVAGRLAPGAASSSTAVGPSIANPKTVQAAKTAAGRLKAEGVFLTPGQRMGGVARTFEDAAGSVPIVGSAISGARQRGRESFNKAVANRALREVGETLPQDVAPGYDSVGYVRQRLNNAYRSAFDKVQDAVADQPLADGFSRIGEAAMDLPENLRTTLQGILQNRVASRFEQGAMTGRQLDDIQSQLGTLASDYMGSQDGGQRLLGRLLEQAAGEVEGLAARNSTDGGASMKAAQKGWANFARYRDASSKIGAANNGNNGVFTPAQFSSAIRAGDDSVAKGRFAEGDALMQDLASDAGDVMRPGIADSGTAGRAANMALAGLTVASPVKGAATAAALTAAAAPYFAMGRSTPEALQRIVGIAQRSAAMGRPAPSQVREYIAQAKGALGAAHPLVQQLEALITSPGALAQEDDPNAPAVTVETIGDMSVADYLAAQKAQQQAPPR